MKILIIIVGIIGFSAVIGAVIFGMKTFDGLVVDKPYETGLLWDKMQKSRNLASGAEDVTACEITRGPCRKIIDDVEIVLDITPKPVKTMENLAFTANLEGKGEFKQLLLDLEMPGMFMGKNVVILKGKEGLYMGKGIIPRCPAGEKLWRATLNVPGKGKVAYLFIVDY